MNPPQVSKRGRPPGRTIGHGRTMYCHYRCRCEVCTTANTRYQKRRALRRARVQAAAVLVLVGVMKCDCGEFYRYPSKGN